MSNYKLPALLLIALLAISSCKNEDLTVPKDNTAVSRSMGDFIRNNYDLSLFAAALTKTGLIDSLNRPGPYTCFAPDNNAFNAIGITSAKDFDTMNTDSLRFAMKYQLIADRKYISDFPFQLGNKYATLAGPNLNVSVSVPSGTYGSAAENRTVYVNGAFVYNGSKRNIPLTNGVIHIVRKPFNYATGTIQDFLQADTSLSMFVAAMKRFNFWDGLKTKGPFTVFAPCNDAFRKYNFSADSINRMDPAAFKTITFGIYPLMLGNRFIYSTDWGQINDIYGGVETYLHLPGFAIRPYYTYNDYNDQENSSITLADSTGGTGTYSPSQIGYRNGIARGADHTTDNGIVHVTDDLLLYPHTLRQ